MPVRFHVLASGSSGNACIVEAAGLGVLIDFGMAPRALAPRMKHCRIAWDRVHAVVLTHDHTDHWNATTLSHLAKLRLPIYCHAEHVKAFNQESRAFAALDAAGLFRHYQPGDPFDLQRGFRCKPLELSHDGAMTCGFRFEGDGWAIGYAADLGCWKPKLARQLADVDLLALEFNHDVAMQLSSGRNPLLIRRVLGDRGHLSNEQAAELFAEVLRISEPGRVRQLVQLHLSRDCNRPDLAEAAAQGVLDRVGVEMPIHTAVQGHAGPSLTLGEAAAPRRAITQPLLPFGE
ncbi:MAG: MBL fold metallo-hydrolase [Planctomycetes bacterium]|nr:MBL fold metallo-hydrolase [Planctomycetota bacterium]